jgi:hypothetical protein
VQNRSPLHTFSAIQERVYGLVYAYLDSLKNAAAVSAGLGERALPDPTIAASKFAFQPESPPPPA